MTKNPKSKQVGMFDTLAKKTAKRSQSEKAVPSVVENATDLKVKREPLVNEPLEPVKQRRNRAKTGKRSDPNYTQVGCYLPRSLNNQVKVKLIDDSRDFSDLVAELLTDWLTD